MRLYRNFADSMLHRILLRSTNVIYNAQGIPTSTTILAEIRVNYSIHNRILRVGRDTRLVGWDTKLFVSGDTIRIIEIRI